MVRTCVVYGCKARDNKIVNRTFHCFPFSRAEICRQWVKKVNRKDKTTGKEWQPNRHSRICSDHFLPIDFKEDTTHKLIKESAVPSVFPNYPQKKKRKISSMRSTLQIRESPMMQPHYDFKPTAFNKSTHKMEDESLDVFCETVSMEDEEVGIDSPQVRVEYADGEDCDEELDLNPSDNGDISFEAEGVEIYQNDVEEEEEDQEMNVYQDSLDNIDTDPTATLHKVMMDKDEAFHIIPVKEEPVEEETETNVGFSPSTSMSIQRGPKKRKIQKQQVQESPPEVEIRGTAIKASTTTRSGRKTTFLKMKKRMAKKSIESPDEVPPGLPAECLVCKAPCTVTKNRKIPSYPFCKKCKKAYFYQQSNPQNSRGQKRVCLKAGKCVIDYRCAALWCPICHLNKFNEILSSLCVDYDFHNEKNIDRYRSKHRRGSLRPEELNVSLLYDALKSSPSVLIERMSGDQLAEYGIASEPPIKQEPIDYQWLTQPVNSSPEKRIRGRPKKRPHGRAPSRESPPHESPPRTSSQNKSFSGNSAQKKTGLDDLEPGNKFPSTSTVKSPLPGSVKKTKSRKILMVRSSSSTDTDEEPGLPTLEGNGVSYSLPAVSIGHTTVNNAVSKGTMGPKSKTQTVTAGQGNSKQHQEYPSTEDQNNYTEVLESIKVYVFTCGHACGLCNSGPSKEWLKESGFYTAKPVLPTSFPPNPTFPSTTSTAQNPKPKPAKSNTPVQLPSQASFSNTTKQKSSNQLPGEKSLPSISMASSQQVLRNLLELKATGKPQINTQRPLMVVDPTSGTISHKLQSETSNSSPSKRLVVHKTINSTSNSAIVSNTKSAGVCGANSITHLTTTNDNQSVESSNPSKSLPSASRSFIDAVKPKTTVISVPSTSRSTSEISQLPTPTNSNTSVKDILHSLNVKTPDTSTSAPIQAVSSVQSVPIQLAPTTFQNLMELQKKGYILTSLTAPAATQPISNAAVSQENINQGPVVITQSISKFALSPENINQGPLVATQPVSKPAVGPENISPDSGTVIFMNDFPKSPSESKP